MFLTYLSHFKRGQRNQLCQKVAHTLLHPPSSILSRISRRCLIATLLGEKMMASEMLLFRASRTWKPQPAAGACCQIVPATGDRFIGLPCQSVTDEKKRRWVVRKANTFWWFMPRRSKTPERDILYGDIRGIQFKTFNNLIISLLYNCIWLLYLL